MVSELTSILNIPWTYPGQAIFGWKIIFSTYRLFLGLLNASINRIKFACRIIFNIVTKFKEFKVGIPI